MPLPDPSSIYPADRAKRAKRAAVEWAHTVNALCPTCRGPMLAGWIDRELVGLVCHRCPPTKKGDSVTPQKED
jgi:hypothetical protein